MNCVPLSEVSFVGTPKRDIHALIKFYAHVSAVISLIGIASGHRVNLSIIVNRYW